MNLKLTILGVLSGLAIIFELFLLVNPKLIEFSLINIDKHIGSIIQWVSEAGGSLFILMLPAVTIPLLLDLFVIVLIVAFVRESIKHNKNS